MHANLPPGVREIDIPGNRQDDELYDRVCEAVSHLCTIHGYDSEDLSIPFYDLVDDAFVRFKYGFYDSVWDAATEVVDDYFADKEDAL